MPAFSICYFQVLLFVAIVNHTSFFQLPIVIFFFWFGKERLVNCCFV